MIFKDRMQREKHTVELMIKIFCKSHNGNNSLCYDCKQLLEQVHGRIENCRYGLNKPNCSKCDIYCYSADMRKRIKVVMKYSGPRMLLQHPVLTLLHLMDGNNKTWL